MNQLLLYIIKVSAAYMLCFLLYWLLFRKESFFTRNRYYLLLSLLIPLAIPFLHFPESSAINTIANNPGLDWVLVFSNNLAQPTSMLEPMELVTTSAPQAFLSIPIVLMLIYLGGLILFLIRSLSAYYRISMLIRHAEKSRINRMILAITKKKVSPFSIFKWLVIPATKKEDPNLNKIIEHEMIHSRQKHSFDLLLSELLLAFQWFNPFLWLLKSAIIRNHEFIVDQEISSSHTDLKAYQYSLIATTCNDKELALVNYFNKSLIKKRIIMMNKKRTPLINKLKNLAIIPLILVLIMVFSAYTRNAESSTPNPSVSEYETNQTEQDQDKVKTTQDNKKGKIVILSGQSLIIQTSVDDKTQLATIDLLDGKAIGDWPESFTKEKIQELLEKLKNKDYGEGIVFVSYADSVEGEDDYYGILIGTNDAASKDYIEIKKKGDVFSIFTQNSDNAITLPGMNEKVTKIMFREVSDGRHRLIMVDGKEVSYEKLMEFESSVLKTVKIYNSEKAISLYGAKAKNGAVIIETVK